MGKSELDACWPSSGFSGPECPQAIVRQSRQRQHSAAIGQQFIELEFRRRIAADKAIGADDLARKWRGADKAVDDGDDGEYDEGDHDQAQIMNRGAGFRAVPSR